MNRHRVSQLIGVVRRKFGDDRGTTVAAALAYYLLLALFPMVLFLVGAASFVLDRDEVKQEVLDGINQVLPIETGGESDIDGAVDGVIDSRGSIALFGVLGLLWSASSFFGALRTSLNDAWGVTQTRPFPAQKAMDIAGVLAIGLLFVLSIVATFMLQLLRSTSDMLPLVGEATGPLWAIVAILLPMAFSFAAFTVVYMYVPNTHVELKHAMAGAIVPALLFEATKFGFSFYLSQFGNYEATYGAFGALIAFLFWAYLTGIYIMVGAQIAAEYPRVERGEYDQIEALRPPGPLTRLRAAYRRLARKSGEQRPSPAEEPLETPPRIPANEKPG
ncbi:MAG: YihY family inner membrane protein [Dehalococcoidia bacterium]|nr:YihY family inner membrane protein [Dehalococcoidia bacterium]